MKLLSTREAAKMKGVTLQAVRDAVRRGTIDGQKVSPRTLVILDNDSFAEWTPNPIRQKAGRLNKNRFD